VVRTVTPRRFGDCAAVVPRSESAVTGLCRAVLGKQGGKHRKWLIDKVLSKVLSVS